ncbi:ATP synthase subunit AtpR [Phaeobacter sp. B1627]|uniref:ATP synthase subunit AtpR n=1 Tax=Phaeobacter sp. B1627 TaxID=2583809 RepID=UPI00111BA8FE|nr:ATP synthase subunit AtpR [Phaeobacter sp. B1627]TNJ43317.1 ATP synthase subunit AtpR [Phaeobacter sp. B1627]
MIPVDWTAAMTGGAIGIVMGALFFAGLALGMRRALRSASAIRLLTISSVVRMTALLGVGWVVLDLLGVWAGLGYAAAFFVTRVIATTLARPATSAGGGA